VKEHENIQDSSYTTWNYYSRNCNLYSSGIYWMKKLQPKSSNGQIILNIQHWLS